MTPRFMTQLATRPERNWAGFGAAEQRAQGARAAEIGGLDAVMAPYDPDGDESGVIAFQTLRATRWLEVVQGVPMAWANPVYAAKTAASAQRFFSGRLGWAMNVDDPISSQSTPPARTMAERLARAEEFLKVARGVWATEDFNFDGTYHRVADGGFRGPLSSLPFPRLYLGGSSEAALRLSTQYADVHLFDDVRAAREFGPTLRAESQGRVEIGAFTRVITREHPAEVAAIRDRLAHADSSADLVGTYDQVGEVIRELVTEGITTFVLDIQPRIEETYRIAEYLLPRVQDTRSQNSRPRLQLASVTPGGN